MSDPVSPEIKEAPSSQTGLDTLVAHVELTGRILYALVAREQLLGIKLLCRPLSSSMS